jgi:uncharacterized membrane protein YgcG
MLLRAGAVGALHRFVVILMCLLPCSRTSADDPDLQTPQGGEFVGDPADLLSGETEAQIQQLILDQGASGRPIFVLTINSMAAHGGLTIAEFSQ